MSTVLKKSLFDIHPREIKGLVKDIPTLPVIYQELFQKMQDPDVSVPAIADIITQDQALSTKILHLVNSAFYGYSRQIRTISRAVVILGFQAVRSAALAISVFDFFKDDDSDGVNMLDFWKHSIAVATTCKVLATEMNIDKQEDAFISGLLHDVGKLIEKQYFDADFREVCTVATEQHISWFECEKALFQIHHATIGKAVFRAWNFPPAVVDAVHFHHEPGTSTKAPQLAALVHVADVIAYKMNYGAPGAWPPAECSPDALKLLGISLEDAMGYEDKIAAELESAMEILSLL